MKRFHKWFTLTILLTLLLAAGICRAESPSVHTQFPYGQSEMSRDLICHRIGSPDAARSLLMVFGVHGFEDAYPHDGEVLKLIAENLIAHYTANVQELQDFCLYIIPCANPDGLIDGSTHNGFGRCNANGYDINRDFPFDWEMDDSDRNRTGETPLVTAEARAICSLVEAIQPTYGVDVHGWKNASYGNGKMAQMFASPFRFKVKRLSTQGMLGAWLHSVTNESILIELPPEPNTNDYVTQNTAHLIEGVNAWISYCSPGK